MISGSPCSGIPIHISSVGTLETRVAKQCVLFIDRNVRSTIFANEYELLLLLYLIQCLTLMRNLNMLKKNGHFIIFYAEEFIKIWDIYNLVGSLECIF